jgi:hypothetical protein
VVLSEHSDVGHAIVCIVCIYRVKIQFTSKQHLPSRTQHMLENDCKKCDILWHFCFGDMKNLTFLLPGA